MLWLFQQLNTWCLLRTKWYDGRSMNLIQSYPLMSLNSSIKETDKWRRNMANWNSKFTYLKTGNFLKDWKFLEQVEV